MILSLPLSEYRNQEINEWSWEWLLSLLSLVNYSKKFGLYLATLSSTSEMDLVLKKGMLPPRIGNTGTIELENNLAT